MVVAEVGAAVEGLAHRGEDRRVRVSEQQGGVAHAEIEVLVAVDVPLARPERALDIDRRDRAVAEIVADAAGDARPQLRVQRPALRPPRGELVQPPVGHLRLLPLDYAKTWISASDRSTTRRSESGRSPVGKRYD